MSKLEKAKQRLKLLEAEQSKVILRHARVTLQRALRIEQGGDVEVSQEMEELEREMRRLETSMSIERIGIILIEQEGEQGES